MLMNIFKTVLIIDIILNVILIIDTMKDIKKKKIKLNKGCLCLNCSVHSNEKSTKEGVRHG